MGENHVIEVRNTFINENAGTEKNDTSKFSFSGINLSKSGILKIGLAINASQIAINTAKTLLIDVPMSKLNRVGSYTGNEIAQSTINNNLNILRDGLSFAKGLITNPVGTIYNAVVQRKDYLLSIQKQNDSAEYLRKTFLFSSNKGETNIWQIIFQ